ncbi:hypothetical protein AAEX63_15685 [Luteococcus sp. H138]|uniref:hypothetical protein n=1 Tax=unclassified Luteococcus TaxID=2639923 RepID=UPI00313CB6EA
MHTDDETVDLLGYLSRLLRYWLPATLVALAVLGAAVGATFLRTGSTPAQADHQAKAHIMLQLESAGDTAGDVGLKAELLSQWMRTFVALQDLPVMMDDVSKAMGGKYTPDEVRDMTSFYWGGGSMLLAVNATAPNEEDSLKMADALASSLISHEAGIVKLPKEKVPAMVQVESAKSMSPDDPEAIPTGSKAGGLLPAVAAALAAWLVTAFLLEARQARRTRGKAVDTAAR